MCIRLPHCHVTIDRVDFATLIAGHHARGNIEGAHQHDKRTRIVFAESGPRGEQEIVNCVHAKQRRLQRIDEFFIAKKREYRIDALKLVSALLSQARREFQRAWVVSARQCQPVAQDKGRFVRLQIEIDV